MRLRIGGGCNTLGAVLITLAVFLGCGSDEGPTKSRAGRDGRVYVRNDTSRIIDVSYLNEETGEIVETEVPAYAQQADVSQVVFEGGSKVKFRVSPRATGEVSGGRGGSQEFEVEIEIDGSRTIWVKKISLQGVGQPEYEII